MQSAGADPIGASLVFLHLLKGQSDRLSEFFLAQAEHVAAQPHAGADMDIDRVWFVTLSDGGGPHEVANSCLEQHGYGRGLHYFNA